MFLHYLDMSMAIMLSILDMGLSFFAFGFLGGNADFGDDEEVIGVGAAAAEVDDEVLGAIVEGDPSGFGFGFEIESRPSVLGFLIGLAGVLESCEVASRFLVESSLATVDEVSLRSPSLLSLASPSLDP